MTKRKKRDPLAKLPLTVAEWKRLAKKLGVQWTDMNGYVATWREKRDRWKYLDYADKAGNSGTLTYTLARAIAKLGGGK